MAEAPDIGYGRARSELQRVLQLAYALPYRQQLRLHHVLHEYLGGEVDGATAADTQMSEREAALAAIARAAKHLGLGEGVPTTQQFNKAMKALGESAWNDWRIRKAFGRWDFAKSVYLGGWAPETPAMRSLRRATSGRKREHEDYLDGLRLWLKTGPATRTREDYSLFVASVNTKRIASGEKPLVQPDAIDTGLGLRWADSLDVAEGREDIEELSQRRAEEEVAAGGELGLVGARGVALILGWSEHSVKVQCQAGEMPQPVAVIGSHFAWFIGDIEAFDAGRAYPRRKAFAWQSRVMDTAQLAKHLGRRHDSMLTALSVRHHRLPPTTGKVSGNHYWMRRDVLKWTPPPPRSRRKPRSR